MMVIVFVATAALMVIACQTIINVFVVRRLPIARCDNFPKVSLLVPARNEAEIIADTVRQLCAQDYPDFEVIVLDDNSTDGTQAVATESGDYHLQVVSGLALPSGWAGKNWACYQLAQQANGDYLLFTDADTRWHPQALSSLIAYQQHTHAGLVTAWPTQKTVTWAERLVVPLMNFVVLGYLPVLMTHYSHVALFGAANGQCMLWQRTAYEHAGGHQGVAASVLDDVSLARRAAAQNVRIRMVDGNYLIGCRMYYDWLSVRDGFAKNILAGYGNSLVALGLSAAFHAIVFLLPLILILLSAWWQWGLGMIALAVGTRALSAAHSHQRVADALLMPLSVLAMQRIALQAVIWHVQGGPRWKGRTLTQLKEPIWSNGQPSSSARASVD